jgi:signal transduction histidine kinase
MDESFHKLRTTSARTGQPSSRREVQLAPMKYARFSTGKLVPAVLIATILVAAAVAVYHALDSWYLQSANASRLRADYSEIAATRFSEQASHALETGRLANTTDYETVFAGLFDSVTLLPRGVPAIGGNEASFAIEVRDPNRRVVFRSGNPGAQPYIAMDTIGASGLVVAVAARKSAVAWLATEHLASRMMLILWLIVLTAVAAVAAMRLMRREARLADARTGFVSSVSHELRTPLAQIQILLETLRLGRINGEAEREWVLEGMQREVTRLTTLVNNVLRFSTAKPSGAASSHQQRATDLVPLLHDIVEGFRPLAAVRRVTIDTDLPSEIMVRSDLDALRQVILNLLDNAVKYGPDGQTIQVTAVNAGEVSRISITDQGIGIPRSDRQRIWNAFERGSNVEGTSVAGSGIGLSVVRDIVKAHGGTVQLDDTVDRGSKFVIELPSLQSSRDLDPKASTLSQVTH